MSIGALWIVSSPVLAAYTDLAQNNTFEFLSCAHSIYYNSCILTLSNRTILSTAHVTEPSTQNNRQHY